MIFAWYKRKKILVDHIRLFGESENDVKWNFGSKVIKFIDISLADSRIVITEIDEIRFVDSFTLIFE